MLCDARIDILGLVKLNPILTNPMKTSLLSFITALAVVAFVSSCQSQKKEETAATTTPTTHAAAKKTTKAKTTTTAKAKATEKTTPQPTTPQPSTPQPSP